MILALFAAIVALAPASPGQSPSPPPAGTHHQHQGSAAPGSTAGPGGPGFAQAASGQTAAPARPGTVDTPSWFRGGEGLYVPPYFDTFEGLDLAELTAMQKERFLHWVNTEFCSCGQTGCRRDTIANCYRNDKTCPWAPVRIRKIYDLVKKGATLPWAPLAAAALPR